MKNKVFTLFKKLLPVYRTLYGPGNLKALNIIRLLLKKNTSEYHLQSKEY